jgi:2-keto-4-pentenoate hydratase
MTTAGVEQTKRQRVECINFGGVTGASWGFLFNARVVTEKSSKVLLSARLWGRIEPETVRLLAREIKGIDAFKEHGRPLFLLKADSRRSDGP